MEDAFEAEAACRTEKSGDVAMVNRPFDLEEGGGIAHGDAALDDGAEALDDVGQ